MDDSEEFIYDSLERNVFSPPKTTVLDLTMSDELALFCAPLSNNDPRVTEVMVGPQKFRKGYGIPLGTSLIGNTHVQKMTLDVNFLLRSTECEDACLAPLKTFLRDSEALTFLVLESTNSVGTKLVKNIFDPITANGRIEKVHLSRTIDVAVHSKAFGNFVKNTTSLRILTCFANTIYDHDAAVALGENTSLERLTINSGHSRFVDAYLSYPSRDSRLQYLRINRDFTKPKFFCARNDLLRLTKLGRFVREVPHLHTLEMGGCSFDAEIMTSFAFGLRDNMAIKKIVFTDCAIDESASKALIAFFREDNLQGKVRHLEFQSRARPAEPRPDLVAVEFLRKDSIQTFKKLTVDVRYLSDFFVNLNNMTECPSVTVPLVHLDLRGTIREADWALLGTILRKVQIRKLTLPMCDDSEAATAFVAVMKRRNITLQKLYFSNPGRLTVNARRFQAYVTRNRQVFHLLAQPVHPPLDPAAVDAVPWLLFPRIAHAVQPLNDSPLVKMEHIKSLLRFVCATAYGDLELNCHDPTSTPRS